MYKKLTKTKEPDNIDKAYEYAVFLLSLKLRTVGEVLKKMESRGYTENTIEQTLERLKDQRYLDDQRYAEIFLENLKVYKYFGYYGIKKKFIEKKVPAELIEKVLNDGFSIKDEEKIARRFLERISPSFFKGRVREGYEARDEEITYRTFDEDASKQKQKLANRLKSRGFRGEVISKLLF